jgi:hypothetical protein
MSWINLSALWKIVVYGFLLGACLPALFAVGLRALALPGGGRVQTAGAGADSGSGSGSGSDQLVGGNVLGMIIAAIIFLIILAAVGWGIYEIYKLGHAAAPAPAPAKK